MSNITTTLAELQTYLRHLGDTHPGIKEVIIGDSEQVLSLDRSKMEYPLLWIETPRVSWTFQDNPRRHYDLHFVVLINTPVDNWQHQQYILHRALLITEQILVKIRDDHDEDLVFVEGRQAVSDAVLGYGHDHDYGYRTSLRIKSHMASCASSCYWPDPCPVGAMARFRWTNGVVGELSDVLFEDTSLPSDEAWTTLWTWQVDSGEVNQSSDPPPRNLGGNYAFVTLTITLGECSLTASALVLPEPACGESVPYLLDQNYC